MYYAMKVLVEEDSVKEFLQDIAAYSEDEVEEMNRDDLQNEAREAVSGILSNELSDYLVLDRNSVTFGDIEVYNPTPNNLDYIFN